MKKKIAAMLALCTLAAAITTGCGKAAPEETVQTEATAAAVVTGTTEATEAKLVKDGKVETPYGTLQIPESAVEYLDVRTDEGEMYTLIFSAALEDHQQDLFDIRFGDTVNNAVGILETAEGESLYVGIDFYPFAPDDSWSQEQVDLVLALQEGVNELLDQLELKELPSVMEEPSQAMEMDTLLGDLQYPEKWESYVNVEHNSDGSVSFYGTLPGREAQLLFWVVRDGETGHLSRQLSDGSTINIFLAEPAFDDTWSVEEQNLIYAMQEDANYLLDSIGE